MYAPKDAESPAWLRFFDRAMALGAFLSDPRPAPKCSEPMTWAPIAAKTDPTGPKEQDRDA